MQLNPAALAVPAFFIFLGIEFYILKRKNKTYYYSWEDSIANITIGVAERLMNLFISGSFFGLFKYVYDNYAIAHFSNKPWVWISLLLFTDFVWYWYHRLGHEINILWGAHIVHHQSEEFNYTVSARITVFQAIIRNLFGVYCHFLALNPHWLSPFWLFMAHILFLLILAW